jgi:hypothetical protein
MTTTGHALEDWRSVPMPARIARLPRDHRGYPILATLKRSPDGRARFAMIDDVRRFILGAFDWCGVCGLPFDGEPKFLPHSPMGDRADDPVSHSEAPVHELCAYYAAQICPYLLDRNAVIAAGPGRGTRRDALVLAGYRRTVGLTPGDNGPTFLLAGCVSEARLDDDVPGRFAQLLAAERPLSISPVAGRLLEMFESADPWEVLLAALALTAFCPDVEVHPEWEHTREFAAFANGFPDEIVATDPHWAGLHAARQWLSEVGDRVPDLIASSELHLRLFERAGLTPW